MFVIEYYNSVERRICFYTGLTNSGNLQYDRSYKKAKRFETQQMAVIELSKISNAGFDVEKCEIVRYREV